MLAMFVKPLTCLRVAIIPSIAVSAAVINVARSGNVRPKIGAHYALAVCLSALLRLVYLGQAEIIRRKLFTGIGKANGLRISTPAMARG